MIGTGAAGSWRAAARARRPPRFDVYRSVSRQVDAIFAEFTDFIQPLSLDEAYLDVTADKAGCGTTWTAAKVIRARTLEGTGLTASAGISYCKFLAKLASDQRKPNGQFAVTPEMVPDWGASLPVSRFQRGSGHGGQNGAARHRYRRRPAGQADRIPSGALRQFRRMVFRDR